MVAARRAYRRHRAPGRDRAGLSAHISAIASRPCSSASFTSRLVTVGSSLSRPRRTRAWAARWAASETRAGSAPPANGSKSIGAKGLGLWWRCGPGLLAPACSLMATTLLLCIPGIEHDPTPGDKGPGADDDGARRRVTKRTDLWGTVLTSRNGLGRRARRREEFPPSGLPAGAFSSA